MEKSVCCKLTIYLWTELAQKEFGFIQTGHVSLQVDAGSTPYYLSWWPNGKKTIFTSKPVLMPHGYSKDFSKKDGNGKHWRYSDTVLAHGKPPHEDKAHIERWGELPAQHIYEFYDWPYCASLIEHLHEQDQHILKRTARYELIFKNCAWAVVQALKAGGSERILSIPYLARFHPCILNQYCDQLYNRYTRQKSRTNRAAKIRSCARLSFATPTIFMAW